MFRWLLKEVWQKINIVQLWKDLRALGRKHGRRFFIAAVLWEMVEDLVFPYFSWRFGAPELIPLFLILHFEPIVYPVFFWGFRIWDRVQGKEPWNPSRPSHSQYWRSVLKVLTFQLAISGWLSHVIGWETLIVFTTLTSLFGFVHERIWHDTNYGINLVDDYVEFKRVAAKTLTYLLITAFTLFPLLRIAKVSHIVWELLVIQCATGLLYQLLETVWAKSKWGVVEE